MQVGGIAQGITHWGAGVTLYSDFTASGHFDCVDQQGGTDPGNIYGEVTSWRLEGSTVVLNVVGKFVGHGGHPSAVEFTVKDSPGSSAVFILNRLPVGDGVPIERVRFTW